MVAYEICKCGISPTLRCSGSSSCKQLTLHNGGYSSMKILQVLSGMFPKYIEMVLALTGWPGSKKLVP